MPVSPVVEQPDSPLRKPLKAGLRKHPTSHYLIREDWADLLAPKINGSWGFARVPAEDGAPIKDFHASIQTGIGPDVGRHYALLLEGGRVPAFLILSIVPERSTRHLVDRVYRGASRVYTDCRWIVGDRKENECDAVVAQRLKVSAGFVSSGHSVVGLCLPTKLYEAWAFRYDVLPANLHTV